MMHSLSSLRLGPGFSLLLVLTTGCIVERTTIEDPGSPTEPGGGTGAPQYTNLTGAWRLKTRDGFGNSQFSATVSVDQLNLTQTSQLAPGYTSDVYGLTGSLTGLTWTIQRRGSGALYVLPPSSGSVLNGAVNASTSSHNLSFNLASTNYVFQGMAPGYKAMWGNASLKINMTSIYGTADGTVTLTGLWDGTRR